MSHPRHTAEAARIAKIRDVLPTSLGSREIREQIAAEIRVRSVFVSRGSNAIFVDQVKRVVDGLAGGELNMAEGRLVIRQVLEVLGYTPEDGFAEDAGGEVPAAVAGTLQDLSSQRRIDFILATQTSLVSGRGQQVRGSSPEQLREFPAWELVRVEASEVPRDWPSRWQIAGGRLSPGGRMIALKGDPVWGELGASGNFDDALDVDFPPFAFNSGMGWRAVSWGECKRLGITGPNGESIDEWQSQDIPLLTGSQPALPAPTISIKDLDPEIRKAFEKSAGIKIVETTATTPGNEDEVRRKLEERRAAREKRRAELLKQAIEKTKKAYDERGDA